MYVCVCVCNQMGVPVSKPQPKSNNNNHIQKHNVLHNYTNTHTDQMHRSKKAVVCTAERLGYEYQK